MDVIDVEVLPDGSIKMTTGRVSMANHGSADMLVREIVKEAGGEAKVRRKTALGGQLHEHEHEGH